MKVEALRLTCNCGRPFSSFLQIGLTDDHQLAVHCWCDECEEIVYVVKSLSDLWRECPSRKSDDALDQTAEIEAPELDDSAFLSAVGISIPADVG